MFDLQWFIDGHYNIIPVEYAGSKLRRYIVLNTQTTFERFTLVYYAQGEYKCCILLTAGFDSIWVMVGWLNTVLEVYIAKSNYNTKQGYRRYKAQRYIIEWQNTLKPIIDMLDTIIPQVKNENMCEVDDMSQKQQTNNSKQSVKDFQWIIDFMHTHKLNKTDTQIRIRRSVYQAHRV